jgi:phosphatidylserine decarboxylase
MFAKEGYTIIATAAGISLALIFIGYWIGSRWSWVLYLFAAVMMLFVLNFFRDPDRVTPTGSDLLIAPADGKIVQIVQLENATYVDGPATQVSIFLSAFDVHVNRIPLNGVIEYVHYYPGEYLLAWHEKASELNEQSQFGLRHASGTKILFKQITGYVARRIVYHIAEGDTVTAGNRFGMMKFGSRMDIIVPANVELDVKVGQRTVAGETVIGRVR